MRECESVYRSCLSIYLSVYLSIRKGVAWAWQNIIHTNNAAHGTQYLPMYVGTTAMRPIYAEKILIKQFTLDLHV